MFSLEQEDGDAEAVPSATPDVLTQESNVTEASSPAVSDAPKQESKDAEVSPSAAPDLLRRKYPEYFDLPTDKGLEVYVWQMAPDSYSCALLPGTNREKTWEELWNLRGTSIEEMRKILSSYDIPHDDIIILPFQNPISSYAYAVNDAYTAGLREMLLGEAAIVTKAVYAGYTEDSRVFASCLNAPWLQISSVRHLPVYLLDSVEDLVRFGETFREVLTLDQSYGDLPSFDDLAAGYDEKFFEENSVILAYVAAGSGAFRFDIQEVVLGEGALCLNVIERYRPEAYTEARAGWLLIAEVPDSYLTDCAVFNAKIVGREDPMGALFDAIVSSPSYSSNPGDYLNAHEEEHRQLLADPKATLRYIFSEFLYAHRTGSSQTGLKGHIMRMILDELAPEAALDRAASNGQEYFDAWMEQALELRALHDETWMESNQPAMLLLLQMMEQ